MGAVLRQVRVAGIMALCAITLLLGSCGSDGCVENRNSIPPGTILRLWSAGSGPVGRFDFNIRYWAAHRFRYCSIRLSLSPRSICRCALPRPPHNMSFNICNTPSPRFDTTIHLLSFIRPIPILPRLIVVPCIISTSIPVDTLVMCSIRFRSLFPRLRIMT